ncbi:abortive infection system antitoxin AbiGi family protein [Halomonas alkaliantarctica]|uniref:abortive infection system antitoxin AbiGi family protein n=1 Tax=Halomonas alkaliantarctica TaxID=232346 RepID=UPI00265B1A18|nr:abortive infection system antitoxin AbiGi family protein [Halomonas alkaliantarctica]
MSGLTQRYISKELVHFVGRGMKAREQFGLLCKILSDGWITHPPHNPNISGNLSINSGVSISENEMYSPEITCFADIPISDLSLHMEKYSSVGLSFSKEFIADSGGVPVHYLPINTQVKRSKSLDGSEIHNLIAEHGAENLMDQMSEVIPKGQHFDDMLREYHELFSIFGELARKEDPSPGVSGLFKRVVELQRFFDFHIFSYLKFFDHRKSDDDPENFYFEREWRIVGNVSFSTEDIKTVFFPRCYSTDFREAFPGYAGQVVFTD